VNATGQEVLSLKLKENPGVIDLSGMANGIYYVRVNTNTFTKTEKVILR
jgi:hypothetical protein